MATGYILFNNKAGNKTDSKDLSALADMLGGDVKYIDVLDIQDYKAFLSGLEAEDYLVLCGGDGTINRFVNNTDGLDFAGEVLYYPNGTGNDFAHEMGKAKGAAPFAITEYLQNLPYVTVNGERYRFLNGVGYGIDGYCCEVGDKQKATSDKKVNYTAIAIKGLLFFHKPTNAKVTVDGETYTFKKVWLAPTMKGLFYGGGIMPTPQQDRRSGKLSTMVFHGSGRLRTLMIFPSIFKGEHVKHTKYVKVMEGTEITVEFDRPTALQIDGETILGVTSYSATANVMSNATV